MKETLSEKLKNANGFEYDFFKTDINGELCEIFIQTIN